ncbi:GIY-YIG nuclease family protein [Firmicutes bacterium AF25-13AC]|nr:GIY-YIG nuclease family protein [Firmicutes bacterium AF25-13AC]
MAAVAAVVTVGAICVATAGAAIAVGSVLSSAAMGVTSTVTETAITVAAAKTAVSAATTAVVAGAVTEYSKLPRNHTVYKLVDNKNTVQYVGRTVNPDKRKQEHAKNPARANLQFEIIRTGLNRYEARGLEQIMMLHYHTLNAMNNQINGISPKNRKLRRYMYAAREIAKYVDNQITDEILYWNCK